MCVHAHVCARVCMHALYVHECMNAYLLYACMHACACILMHSCMKVCMHVGPTYGMYNI